MKNTLETRLGIFVAMAVIAAVLLLEVVGGTEILHRGYKLYALFDSVQDLKQGDRIKMAGVDVGRVEEIKLAEDQNKVLVTMKLYTKDKVRTDSTATIKFTGLMGQNFIGIDFGKPGSPIATPGTYLPTSEVPDISAMMAKLDNVADGIDKITSSFTGLKLDTLFAPFVDFMKANQVPLTATIDNFRKVSTQIAEGQGTVGKLIFDDSLYNSALASVRDLQSTSDDIKLTLGDARKAVDQANNIIGQVNAGQGTIGKLLKDDALYRETTASMTNLREILQKVNQGQGSAGKIVNDDDLYKNAKLTLQKLDKATEGLEDQGPLSVMGILVNNLF